MPPESATGGKAIPIPSGPITRQRGPAFSDVRHKKSLCQRKSGATDDCAKGVRPKYGGCFPPSKVSSIHGSMDARAIVIGSGQHHIGACVTTEKQKANAAVGFGYCEVN